MQLQSGAGDNNLHEGAGWQEAQTPPQPGSVGAVRILVHCGIGNVSAQPPAVVRGVLPVTFDLIIEIFASSAKMR